MLSVIFGYACIREVNHNVPKCVQITGSCTSQAVDHVAVLYTSLGEDRVLSVGAPHSTGYTLLAGVTKAAIC